MGDGSGPREVVVDYEPRGASKAFWTLRDNEVLIHGPAGTGKTVGVLQKIHRCAQKYPGSRHLFARKTLISLTGSALVTYQRHVKHPLDGVTYFGGNRVDPPAFRYPNGSEILVGGLDKATKVMSAEYDTIYVNEATEIPEATWDSLLSRLRNGKMPYQQLVGDCNPGPPTHWLWQRAQTGTVTALKSVYQDNPRFWDAAAGDWTDDGRAYVLGTLSRLTGVRRLRLLEGIWAAAEGLVYERFDPDRHVVNGEDHAERLRQATYFGTADWGWTNPGVVQVWALDWDGRLLLVAERYMTGKTVEGWWVPQAVELSARYGVTHWACDPAEPQYIDAFRRAGLRAYGAVNDLLPGIVAVQERLEPDGTGLPRLMLLAGAAGERDAALVEARLPTCTADEFPEYVWAKDAEGRLLAKERPVDANNHGLDALRYAVADVDLRQGRARPITPDVAAYFHGMPD